MGLGLGALGFVLVLGVRGSIDENPREAPLLAGSASPGAGLAEDAGDAGKPVDATAADGAPSADAAPDVAPPPPPPPPPSIFRVAQLALDPSLALSDGTMGHRPFLLALAAAGVGKAESYRVVRALNRVHNLNHLSPTDTFHIAREKASGRVVAFEYVTSPVDVFQARDEAGVLTAKKLELHFELKQVAKAVVVSTDLRASLATAGLEDEIVQRLEDALDPHVELADIRAGSRLRLLATEERLERAFLRYASLDAVEYTPPKAEAAPLRLYRFPPIDPDKVKPSSPMHAESFYDAKGQQPVRGGWRVPVPVARIASRFNPHRMHPTLHVIMPHNGVDFAAPTGTPIYAAAPGTVKSAGDSGPCGNMVQIEHSAGLVSSYCHMSRFAPGIHVGEHVETRQLIGYVGQTGRATGPHLHFAIKRDGIFIDPLALRLDGVRVVPPSHRDEFDAVRVELDRSLDAIALEPPPSGSLPAEPEVAAPDGGADAAPEDPIFDEAPLP
jgi:murein DD-endopeptidase MepM/ murein hydrolase activator NlpD